MSGRPTSRPGVEERSGSSAERPPGLDAISAWLFAPQPIERLVALRIGVPLAILGFMSGRIVHADHWIGSTGFSVPDIGGDWRQPVYVPALANPLAWALVVVMVLSGLSTAIGFRTRVSAGLFAATLAYVAVADRLAAFTVSKIGPVLVIALCASAAGERRSVDAWLSRRARPGDPEPTHAPGGPIRFIQLFLPIFYASSGICKCQGDWLHRGDVLFTNIDDSYQTVVAYWLGNLAPGWAWAVLQWTTLAFETLAPLWFGLRKTRYGALVYGVGMHLMIGAMFGPVIWFALLMIVLLISAYAPARWLRRLVFGAATRGEE